MTTGPSTTAPAPTWSAAALAVAWAGAVTHQIAPSPAILAFASIGLFTYLLGECRALRGMGKMVLAGALLASAGAWPFLDAPSEVVAKGASTAVFFVAILLSGGFLREAAEHSPLITSAGQALIGQPPARRNGALSVGAFLMGFILSFGTLQLLGAMVARANTLENAGGNERVRRTRERRSMLAVLRGFCISTVCNPISIVIALALTFAPGAQWGVVMVIVISSAVFLLLLSALIDWLTEPRVAPGAGLAPSLRPVVGLVGIVGIVFACVFTTAWVFELKVIQAMMITVPAVALIWMTLQSGGRIARVGHRLGDQMCIRYPQQRTEVTILASAGFAGTLVATALPVEAIAQLLVEVALPGLLVPVLIFWWVMLGAQLALNPIITVTLAGAVLPVPLVLGVAPEVVAASYMIAWGVCTAASPFTLSVLIISGLAGQDSRTVAWHWNRRFSIIAAAGVTALLIALAMWLSPLA